MVFFFFAMQNQILLQPRSQDSILPVFTLERGTGRREPWNKVDFFRFFIYFLRIKLKSLLATQHTHIGYFICLFFSPHLFSTYLGDVNKLSQMRECLLMSLYIDKTSPERNLYQQGNTM